MTSSLALWYPAWLVCNGKNHSSCVVFLAEDKWRIDGDQITCPQQRPDLSPNEMIHMLFSRGTHTVGGWMPLDCTYTHNEHRLTAAGCLLRPCSAGKHWHECAMSHFFFNSSDLAGCVVCVCCGDSCISVSLMDVSQLSCVVLRRQWLWGEELLASSEALWVRKSDLFTPGIVGCIFFIFPPRCFVNYLLLSHLCVFNSIQFN